MDKAKTTIDINFITRWEDLAQQLLYIAHEKVRLSAPPSKHRAMGTHDC